MALVSKQFQNIVENSGNLHKNLREILENDSKIVLGSNSKKLVQFDASVITKINEKIEKLIENDLKISEFCRNKVLLSEFTDLKKSLGGIKRLLIENSNKINRDIKKVSLILQEYKERCRCTLIDFLKALDVDLRKALKPLVPNQVLQEQLIYKPINPEAALLSSLNSNAAEEEKPSDNTVDKLNNHIQLLINTLEGVAKDLIAITQSTSQKYYEVVDPLVLYSEPPSPLAAPLPDYFSYDLGNISEVNNEYPKNTININPNTQKRLLEKFRKIEKGHDTSCNKSTAMRIQEKLMILFKENIKEIDLLELFKEEGMPMTEREKIVFEIINTDRSSKGRDVSLEEIIQANDLGTYNPNFEISRNDYSQILKNIQGKDLTDSVIEDCEKFSSLQSSIDEKFIRNPSRVGLFEKKSSVLPPISLSKSKSKRPLGHDSKPSLKDIKLRSSTPNKLSSKSSQKRSHTPGLKKKKKS